MRLIRRSVALFALVAATLTVSACGGIGGFGGMGANTTNIQIGSAPYTEGSGTIVTRTRDLPAFQKVVVDNGVTVTVARGDKPAAAVTTDDNLVDMISTDVATGTLTIKVTGGLRTHHRIDVMITAAETLTALTVGNGATLDIESIGGESTSVSAMNGATVRGGGKTTNLVLTVHDGATADLRNVETETATVTIDNGSTAHVRASKTVSGTCHGGSTTVVHGAARVDMQKDAGSTVRTE